MAPCRSMLLEDVGVVIFSLSVCECRTFGLSLSSLIAGASPVWNRPFINVGENPVSIVPPTKQALQVLLEC